MEGSQFCADHRAQAAAFSMAFRPAEEEAGEAPPAAAEPAANAPKKRKKKKKEKPETKAHATAEQLRSTSLLQQLEVLVRDSDERIATLTRYTLHPATAQFIEEAHEDAPELKLGAHRRVGEQLEIEAQHSADIETHVEAGYHLFQVKE